MLIYSRKPDATALSFDEIKQRAPAVFTTDHTKSAHYGQVTTAKAITILGDFGYYPVQAVQKGKSRHATHLISFAKTLTAKDRPELLLYNSHDGTSALKLFAGYFRVVCSNGLVAGTGTRSSFRHTTGTVNQFENLISSAAAVLQPMMDRIEELRTTPVNAPLEFVRTAAGFRWADELITQNTLDDLYQPRRMEDATPNMFTLLNRVQEGLIRGGVRVGPNNRIARALSSIEATTRINTKLWEIA